MRSPACWWPAPMRPSPRPRRRAATGSSPHRHRGRAAKFRVKTRGRCSGFWRSVLRRTGMVRMTTHSRHGVAALAVLLASILVLAPAARGEAVGTTAFDHPGTHDFRVPDGIYWLTVKVEGGHGGSGDAIAPGGHGGGVTTTIPVTPQETLKIHVGGYGGGHGGEGWSHGGDHCTADGALNDCATAGGGGGSSAVARGSTLLVGAVGGGGGGGDGGSCTAAPAATAARSRVAGATRPSTSRPTPAPAAAAPALRASAAPTATTPPRTRPAAGAAGAAAVRRAVARAARTARSASATRARAAVAAARATRPSRRPARCRPRTSSPGAVTTVRSR